MTVTEDAFESFIAQNTHTAIALELRLPKGKTTSYFGGKPLASPDFKWPNDDGKLGQFADMFLGQINIGELPWLPEGMVRSGILYFFINVGAAEDGDADAATVIYHPISDNLIKHIPQHSPLYSNASNFMHHSRGRSITGEFDEGYLRKVEYDPIAFNTFRSPDYFEIDKLPDRTHERIDSFTKNSRYEAYSLAFGKQKADQYFLGVPETIRLSDLSVAYKTKLMSYANGTENVLNDHFCKAFCSDWPQRWGLVDIFCQELIHELHYQPLSQKRKRMKSSLFVEFHQEVLSWQQQALTYSPHATVAEYKQNEFRSWLMERFDEFVSLEGVKKSTAGKAKQDPLSNFLSSILGLGSSHSLRVLSSAQSDQVNLPRLFDATSSNSLNDMINAVRKALSSCLGSKSKSFKSLLDAERVSFSELPSSCLSAFEQVIRSRTPHQMFGIGADYQGHVETALSEKKLLLLQLEDNNTIGFSYGAGNIQLWISPEDLTAGNWAGVTFTGAC
ncbi:DUF1963 domain-containing protein [Pseudovibrio ascidiaceicola]|nr:DUF1963 domain-containing protein [Pseudovibrio ascidiaceicola]